MFCSFCTRYISWWQMESIILSMIIFFKYRIHLHFLSTYGHANMNKHVCAKKETIIENLFQWEKKLCLIFAKSTHLCNTNARYYTKFLSSLLKFLNFSLTSDLQIFNSYCLAHILYTFVCKLIDNIYEIIWCWWWEDYIIY